MPTVLRMSPKLHFPVGVVFEVPDQFNGRLRGTHYFRSTDGTLHGPFPNEAHAEYVMLLQTGSDGA